MSLVPTSSADDARWEEWRLKSAGISRRDERKSRIAGVLLVAGAAVWVLIELMSSPAFA